MTEEIVDERFIVRKKSNKRYINGIDLHNSLVNYYNECEKNSLAPIPAYIGECLMHIANNLSTKYRFSAYTFREEMISDALEKMVEAVVEMKYDPSISQNPFAYFTQISWNCLDFSTLVPTLEYGIVPIGSLEGKEVHIIDGNGDWVKSKCCCYGKQELYNIEISGSVKQKSKFLVATGDHNWYLNDGERVSTLSLKEKDVLLLGMTPKRTFNDTNLDYKKGIIHGLIYGDGHANYKSRIHSEKVCSGFAIRLCDKSKELSKYFNELNYKCSYPKSYKGEPIYYVNSALDLKMLPSEDWFNNDYLTGFVRGWLGADGNVASKTSRVTLCCGLEGREWLNKFGPRLGFYITNEYLMKRNRGKFISNIDQYNLTIDRRWLIADDIICSWKRINFSSKVQEEKRRFGKVLSVSFAGIDKVYCFEVPTTHSFMLTNNIITGNCFLQRVAKERKETYILHKNMDRLVLDEAMTFDDEDHRKIYDLVSDELHTTIINEFEKPKQKYTSVHRNLSYKANRERKGRKKENIEVPLTELEVCAK